jgi:hypothetical protein
MVNMKLSYIFKLKERECAQEDWTGETTRNFDVCEKFTRSCRQQKSF